VRLAEKTKSQVVVTNTSVGIAFATFVGVLVYHTYQQLWPKLQQRIHHLRHCKEHKREVFDEGGIDNQRQISTLPTLLGRWVIFKYLVSYIVLTICPHKHMNEVKSHDDLAITIRGNSSNIGHVA